MIAVISDIHGNLAALETVLKSIKKLNCSKIISLGDIVGYYAQPGQCIDLLKSHNVINIMGNHDSYLVNEQGCSRSKMVSEIIAYHKTIVSCEQKMWLSSSITHYIDQGNYFTHGGWKSFLEQYMYKPQKSDLPTEAMNFFSGHTHVQVLSKFGKQQYCNPGSVGQPRDGDPRASFATLSDNEIQLHRVDYDIDKTAHEMKVAGFPKKYYENLYIGAQIGGRIDKV